MNNKTTDFTALDGIKPITGTRGYSVFTREEGERIRAFYFANRTTAKDIADCLKVNRWAVVRAIKQKHKYTRRSVCENNEKGITDELIRHHLSETFFAAKLGDLDCVLANIKIIESRLRFLEGVE